MNPLPINPAIVAAALNQWGLIGNMQQQNQNQDQVGVYSDNGMVVHNQTKQNCVQGGNQPWSRQQGGGSGSQGGQEQKHYI